MNTSLQCSANSAFGAPNIQTSYDLLNLDRTSQFATDAIEPYFEQREAQMIQPTPICLENYNSFLPSVYNPLPTQNNLSLPMIPFPFLHEFGFETGFIRKRNERERMRVRTVNEGYAHLREHLPLDISEKRMSKVETLRAAINYIKYLQETLHQSPGKETSRKRKRAENANDDNAKREYVEIK